MSSTDCFSNHLKLRQNRSTTVFLHEAPIYFIDAGAIRPMKVSCKAMAVSCKSYNNTVFAFI